MTEGELVDMKTKELKNGRLAMWVVQTLRCAVWWLHDVCCSACACWCRGGSVGAGVPRHVYQCCARDDGASPRSCTALLPRAHAAAAGARLQSHANCQSSPSPEPLPEPLPDPLPDPAAGSPLWAAAWPRCSPARAHTRCCASTWRTPCITPSCRT